jgi:hypothetical protein
MGTGADMGAAYRVAARETRGLDELEGLSSDQRFEKTRCFDLQTGK